MKTLTISITLFFLVVNAKSQVFYVKERADNLENIVKRGLSQRSDSLTELESKSDYVIKIEAETRGVLERGTVKLLLVSTATGKSLFQTDPEKVASNNGVPTNQGIRRGLTRIVSNQLDSLTTLVRKDYQSQRK